MNTQYNQGFLRGQSPESSSTASKSRGHRKIGMSDLSQSSQLTSSTSLRSHGSHSESKTSDNKYGNNYDSASRISGHSQNYGHFGNEHNANDSNDRYTSYTTTDRNTRGATTHLHRNSQNFSSEDKRQILMALALSAGVSLHVLSVVFIWKEWIVNISGHDNFKRM